MKTKRVAVGVIIDDDKNILMGKRNDNNLWTIPGGHAKKNEDIYEAMIRELKEETGLDAKQLKIVKVCKKKEGSVLVYVFRISVDKDQKVDTSGDPDNEVDVWEYADPFECISKLHVPISENYAIKHWAREILDK